MAVGDKLLGLILLLAAGFIFVYYTIWVLVLVSKRNKKFCSIRNLTHVNFDMQPFVEEKAVLNLFPPRIYAIAIPAALLVLAITLIGSFIGLVLINESKKSKKK
jgi:dolichol phosphate-mannose biosynthesis regulatory protein